MFFETTPDTSAYLIGGYAFAFITMTLYLISLVVRTRNLKQDLSMLEGLAKEPQEGRKSL